MCFENNKTGQREGLSEELMFELRSRNQMKAAVEGATWEKRSRQRGLRRPEAGAGVCHGAGEKDAEEPQGSFTSGFFCAHQSR